jgi:hypothetical protein
LFLWRRLGAQRWHNCLRRGWHLDGLEVGVAVVGRIVEDVGFRVVGLLCFRACLGFAEVGLFLGLAAEGCAVTSVW